MSLRRSLFLLAVLPVALPAYVLASRLGFLTYTVNPAKLPRRTFARLTATFLQCPDCGRDGLLVVSGRVMARVVTHQRAVRMLHDWAHTLSAQQYAELYRQVAAADWLENFLPMPSLPSDTTNPNFGQVHACVRIYLVTVGQWRESTEETTA